MGRLDEILSKQFARWEQRGRGWQVWPYPVRPEPPFQPFARYRLPRTNPEIDDGRRPGVLANVFDTFERMLNPKPPVLPDEEVEEPEPEPAEQGDLVELQTSLPADLDISKEAFEQFLLNLSLCREPVSLELLGCAGRVSLQFVAGAHDAAVVRRQLHAYFPEAVFLPQESGLEQTWVTCSGDDGLVVEFGLAREFMLSLAKGKLDPFVGLVGSLSELQSDELGLFQVLWQPVQYPWAESIMRSVTLDDGKPFFVNRQELVKAAEAKVSRPLFAAVVRVATKAKTFERALQIACDMAGSLRVFGNPQGNELIPLKNDDYPFDDHIQDVFRRQSRRSGMLLNCDELIGFVHLPSSAVRSPALERDTGTTKAAPAVSHADDGILLGTNTHAGKTVEVRLKPDQRVYHTHIIGATGTGKSTLLFNLIRQDIENDEGIAVFDPHGDLVDKIVGIIPPERIDDVILVDPADDQFSIGFNILSAHSDHEKTLLASDLVSVFQRLSTSWGDQMQSVFQNATQAFLNSSRGGTLADLRRFLVEPGFRSEFLKSVSDPNVLYYWHKGFAQLSGNKSIGPVLTRLEMFLAQRPIAHMVSQSENRLDFGEIMDRGKIFLAKLPEGLLGRENSHLLGAVLVSKFQQLVMARQARKVAARRDFWIYIDEFANFITPSMAEILSGARKYRIGLTLAHHELHQLERNKEVASAVMTHPYTRVVFRVGDDDARKLADGFSFFEARALKNLERGQAVCRVERSDFDFNLSVPLSDMPDEAEMAARQEAVIAASRKKYGTPRAEVEAMLRQAWELDAPKSTTTKPKPPPNEPSASPPSQPVVPTSQPTSPPVSLPPKLSEVPKETGSEEEKPVPPVEREAAPAPPADLPPTKIKKPAIEPRDLGRGGALHTSIQKRIQTEARALGFDADIERQLSKSSNQAADVLLRRGDVVIAVEVSVTTDVDDEFRNVKKCLEAGIPHVAVVATKPRHLKALEDAVRAGLGPEAASKVGYFDPDGLIAALPKLAASAPPPSTTETEVIVKGRKVRRHGPQLSAAEHQQRENTAYEALIEVIKPR